MEIWLEMVLEMGLGMSFRNAQPHIQQHKPSSPKTYRRWLWLVLAVLHWPSRFQCR